MTYFLLGAAGTLAVLGLLSLGAFCGWKARERFQQKAAQEVNEEAQRRLEAEQQAFSSMMNYNANIAYGMDRSAADLFGGNG